MADWEKRATKVDDVIYFPYVSEKSALNCHETYVWDVDKTYLDTKFETVRGLLKTATEKANQKKNIPGAAKLVQSLKDQWIKVNKSAEFPIFFITASPPQMERKIREKLNIDGIKPFGIFCKDNLKNLSPRRLWRLNKQVGYKLQALMHMRALLSENIRLIMFGDDGESDSIIYSLFSDICARRMNSSDLRKVLNFFYVLDNQVDAILKLQDAVPNNDPVEKVYINLVDDTDADYYLKFGRRTLPTSNSFQAALDLCQDQRIGLNHVEAIAKNLLVDFAYTNEELEKSIDDLVRRNKLSDEFCNKLIPFLIKNEIISTDFELSVNPKTVTEKRGDLVITLDGTFEPWIPEHIDYMHDYR